MDSLGDLYSERAVRGRMTTAKADLRLTALPDLESVPDGLQTVHHKA
jgi:hypothetical protein